MKGLNTVETGVAAGGLSNGKPICTFPVPMDSIVFNPWQGSDPFRDWCNPLIPDLEPVGDTQ
jgi:hypothetical protein